MMTDLIDRQALLQALCNEDGTQHEYCYPCKAVLDVVNAQPSAQPEKRTNERTETHACDLISRAAAISTAATMCERCDTGDIIDYRDMMVAAMEVLPSAQPEPIKINIDDFNKEDWERLKKEWGNTPITVLSAQPEIIRCKDCEYQNKGQNESETWNLCGYRPWQYTPTTDEHFCGYAERREDG